MVNRGFKRRRRLCAPLTAIALVTLAACEVPTSPPRWDTLWIAPGQGTTISAASLLPSQVSTTASGDAFVVDLAPVTTQKSLGEACPACALANGLTLPKPAFTIGMSESIVFPEDLLSVKLANAEIAVSLTHDFGFDPLRPSETARGSIVIEIRSGTTTLTKYTIEGASWPAGEALTRVIPVGSADVVGSVQVAITLESPAGDPVVVNTNQSVSATVTPTRVVLSEATVRVESRQIDTEPVDLDVEDIDDAVIDHQKGGALLLDISNPFGVTGQLELMIESPTITIRRPLTLRTGESTERVELSESELGSILGESPVRLSIAGAVSATGPGGISVSPNQSVVVDSRLELTIGPKEDQ